MSAVRVFIDRDELTPALRELIDRLPEVADQIIRKLAFDIVADVAERVPVDTGRYRAGWRVSLDVLAGDGSSDTVDVETSGDETRIVVTNPVQYGPYIEYGTSTRPPGLQLQTAIASARASLGIETIAGPVSDVWDEVT
jgi:hypothetical protein